MRANTVTSHKKWDYRFVRGVRATTVTSPKKWDYRFVRRARGPSVDSPINRILRFVKVKIVTSLNKRIADFNI